MRNLVLLNNANRCNSLSEIAGFWVIPKKYIVIPKRYFFWCGEPYFLIQGDA
jgi:hypothetical protein